MCYMPCFCRYNHNCAYTVTHGWNRPIIHIFAIKFGTCWSCWQNIWIIIGTFLRSGQLHKKSKYSNRTATHDNINNACTYMWEDDQNASIEQLHMLQVLAAELITFAINFYSLCNWVHSVCYWIHHFGYYTHHFGNWIHCFGTKLHP